MRRYLLLVAILTSVIDMANASVIGVAFDNFNGIPTGWNDAGSLNNATPDLMNLQDEQGDVTSIDFRLFDWALPGGQTPASGTIPIHGDNSLNRLNSYRGPLSQAGASPEAAFFGLDPAQTYYVWLINLNQAGDWTIKGNREIAVSQQATIGQLWFNSEQGDSGRFFMDYPERLKPDEFGKISFIFKETPFTSALVAGFAIQAVPLPGALLMLLSGVTVAFARRGCSKR